MTKYIIFLWIIGNMNPPFWVTFLVWAGLIINVIGNIINLLSAED